MSCVILFDMRNMVSFLVCLVWHERRHTSTIPNPGAAGEYTLEVYVNRQLLKSIDFAIS